jgi:hypothetical protein
MNPTYAPRPDQFAMILRILRCSASALRLALRSSFSIFFWTYTYAQFDIITQISASIYLGLCGTHPKPVAHSPARP